MTTVFLRTRSVAVETDGEGQPVVCIHGLGGSTNSWTPILPAFEGKRIIRLDLPGSARSELSEQRASIDLYVETLEDVLSELAVSDAQIVAHSMGTIVAQHIAVKRPDLVRSLVLFGPLTAPPEQARAGIRSRAALCREKGIVGLQEIADAVVKAATSGDTKAHRPVAVAMVRESVMRQTPEGYAQSCEALADAQAAEIEQITIPALLVTGDEDGIGQPAAVKSMAERIPKSAVAVLTGCGHWATVEKPADCIAELRQFYRGLPR
jgi:3-oxoadipate enol-lactonase